MSEHDKAYKNENLRLLRLTLGLTQKQFIERFLSDDDGTPLISVATLSNLESRGGMRLDEVILRTAEGLGMDVMSFLMQPEEFAENIHELLPNGEEDEAASRSQSGKRGNIGQLLNRLTMYFAEQIFEKNLKKGDKIESDRELAERFGVGRSAVREAMKVLDVLGMVDIRPGQGTYISNNESNFFIIPLSWSLFLNGSQIDDLVDVRNVLEVRAAFLTAVNTDEEGRRELHENMHLQHQSYLEKDYNTFLKADLDFHSCIARCSGNQVIYSMNQTIRNLMRHISGTGMVNEEQLRDIYQEHQKIYGLILAGDGDGAAEAMKEHLRQSRGRYRY